ncbi:anti-anti-sigma factor [Nitrincola tibetensis]|jgi:anti-anti-sigma factor|uniref:Anti-anti-sigma factor n=1 Tax=Nitrincola tibetensis TaxID=2219697 RepID=A0A364NI49_9GAMM|nr:STAS domain-containing protein [Nitrincola tibetensis]RAU16742.1 anti-anti-sigma factor [Nitrincola tibetensis]
MSDGEIFFACRDGHYVLKFVGEVRLTLCSTIDQHLAFCLAKEEITDTLIDLTETNNIDSTSLGLIAKLAIKCSERNMPKPTIVSTNPDITQILLAMGFDKVFVLLDVLPTSVSDLKQVPFVLESENEVRLRIIQAHKVLIDLNEANRDAFKGLVETLEKCS